MSWQSTLAALQQRARNEQQQGAIEKAGKSYEEALDILHREEPGGTESVQAELALRTDYGNLLRQTKKLPAAVQQFKAALAAIDTVDAADELEIPRVGTTLQLASCHMDSGDVASARPLVDSIGDGRIESLGDPQARAFMMVDVSRLRGDLSHARKDFGTAAEHWATALRRAHALLQVHPPASVMYARQFLERLLATAPAILSVDDWRGTLSVVGDIQEALATHVEEGAEGANEQFVRLELLRAEVARRAGQMAQSEDSMWRALDLDESWMTLMGALGIYTRLVLETDERLSAGNLPREEVSAGVAEFASRLEGRSDEVDEPEIFQTLLDLWKRWAAQNLPAGEGRNRLAQIGDSTTRGAHVRALHGVLNGVLG